ncbi:MAG TPA: hypothetical protein H9935_00085 [Candidatus Blautia merdigallinarum]|uniref:Uncharacterized protein n=1 Tax=Candidatus Blautia merdigallinarum TaxID=2838495 RepID=A0A9D2SJL2_9FIRM|nr:hypothetical protein [Candidatus Blautia merdigallinarum]
MPGGVPNKVSVRFLLKKYPVTDRISGSGYNTPASRSAQEHWDYAQEIAPDIFRGIAIGVIFLLLGFYRTETKIKNRFSED